MSEQLTLWDRPSLNPLPRLKEAMRQALKRCQLSRGQVVDQMNTLAHVEGISTNGRKKETSEDILDKWVSASGEHVIPLKLLPIFCRVVGDNSPFLALVSPLGLGVIDKEEAALLEWARLEQQSKRLRRKQRKLAAELDI